MKQKIINLLRSLAILYAILYLGIFLQHLIPIGVPGSIWGLLILFLCLTSQVIKVEWIAFGSSLLIRYMALLFVPVSVGIVKYADLLLANAKQLVIPNIISTMMSLLLVGLMGDYLFERHSIRKLRRKVAKKRLKQRG
ncbi:CidA/LrgA family protein [Pasteurella testudinis]|uniref:CidA/LrgA family protein n=1 Tax=Pasteurella testudinis TaxID=761 RepID=UPI000E05D6D3|nr:CidA/LrgA family protein [Pasteurella testudinis]SUB51776.1 membrane protein [Pasteurella testudinis]